MIYRARKLRSEMWWEWPKDFHLHIPRKRAPCRNVYMTSDDNTPICPTHNLLIIWIIYIDWVLRAPSRDARNGDVTLMNYSMRLRVCPYGEDAILAGSYLLCPHPDHPDRFSTARGEMNVPCNYWQGFSSGVGESDRGIFLTDSAASLPGLDPVNGWSCWPAWLS